MPSAKTNLNEATDHTYENHILLWSQLRGEFQIDALKPRVGSRRSKGEGGPRFASRAADGESTGVGMEGSGFKSAYRSENDFAGMPREQEGNKDEGEEVVVGGLREGVQEDVVGQAQDERGLVQEVEAAEAFFDYGQDEEDEDDDEEEGAER